MSFAKNHSIKVLRGMLMGHVMNYQKLQKQFKAQETRLLQRPDQTGVLTIEQQDLKKRVSTVSDAYEETGNLLSAVRFLFDDYDQAQPNDQPQLRDQREAKMDELTVMMINFEGKVQELMQAV